MDMLSRIRKAKEIFPTTLAISLLAWLFGLYSAHKTEMRENAKSLDLNEQRIVENYFNAIKEIKYNADYARQDLEGQEENLEEADLIHNLTTITLRELSAGSDRKSSIVLLIHKMGLSKIFLTGKLAGNNEQETFYRGADLKLVDFNGYDLKQAELSKADLRGANFNRSRLDEAALNNADLSCFSSKKNGQMFNIDVGWIPFSQELIVESVSTCSRFHAANLAGATLRKANLTGASLHGADLRRADLSGADLSRADLRHADLRRATLRDVIWKGADVRCADFRDTPISRAFLRGQGEMPGSAVRNVEEAIFTAAGPEGGSGTPERCAARQNTAPA